MPSEKLEERRRLAIALGSRLPPGQVLTAKWPVLQYGEIPVIDLAKWRFEAKGLVDRLMTWTWEEFNDLPQVEIRSDVHCVTRWSRLDNVWTGVPVREVLDRIGVRPAARAVMLHGYDGYTTNLPLDDFDREGNLFARLHDGAPLAPEHGAPLRLVVPHLYFWKSAKWIRGIELLAEDRPGLWEENGYHMRGDPWREERYGDL